MICTADFIVVYCKSVTSHCYWDWTPAICLLVWLLHVDRSLFWLDVVCVRHMTSQCLAVAAAGLGVVHYRLTPVWRNNLHAPATSYWWPKRTGRRQCWRHWRLDDCAVFLRTVKRRSCTVRQLMHNNELELLLLEKVEPDLSNLAPRPTVGDVD